METTEVFGGPQLFPCSALCEYTTVLCPASVSAVLETRSGVRAQLDCFGVPPCLAQPPSSSAFGAVCVEVPLSVKLCEYPASAVHVPRVYKEDYYV